MHYLPLFTVLFTYIQTALLLVLSNLSVKFQVNHVRQYISTLARESMEKTTNLA